MMTALHVVTYTLAAFGVFSAVQQVPRVQQRRRARSHEAIMARIARLEIQTGVGLSVAREWLERAPKITHDEHLVMSGKWQCYGCGDWFEANGYGFRKLCKSCREAADVDPLVKGKGSR